MCITKLSFFEVTGVTQRKGRGSLFFTFSSENPLSVKWGADARAFHLGNNFSKRKRMRFSPANFYTWDPKTGTDKNIRIGVFPRALACVRYSN